FAGVAHVTSIVEGLHQRRTTGAVAKQFDDHGHPFLVGGLLQPAAAWHRLRLAQPLLRRRVLAAATAAATRKTAGRDLSQAGIEQAGLIRVQTLIHGLPHTGAYILPSPTLCDDDGAGPGNA